MEEPTKNNTATDKHSRKLLALFIIIIAYYITMVGFELPSIAHFRVNWAYALGMVVAGAFCLADRFLKHANSPEFQKGKLLKSHLFFFVIFCPASLFLILPTLGPPQNIWSVDYKTAFLISFFFITAGSKIPVNYERLEQLLNGSKKDK